MALPVTLSGVDLWRRPPITSDVVEKFLHSYESEDAQKEWGKLRDRAMDICKEQLKDQKLLAHVSGRVKDAASLRKRLYEFPPPQGYKEEKYILEPDLNPDRSPDGDRSPRDFVGLRISIYFPDQQLVVGKLIQKAFEEQSDKRKLKGGWLTPQVDLSIQSYQRKFGGYDEFHYWAKLRAEDRENVGRYSGLMFEIQLRSVIMDSWDTIHHDLEYKTLHGDPSREERRVLDGIKGLASTGEVLLEHLQEIRNLRLKSDEKTIESESELGRLLQNYLPEIETTSATPANDNNDFVPLFRLLVAAGITTIGALRETLEKLEIRKKLRDEYQKWANQVHLFPATQLDFMLYTVLRQIPDQSIDAIWEKVFRAKAEYLCTSPRNEAFPFQYWFLKNLIPGILTSMCRYIDSQHNLDEGTLIYDDSITETFSMAWYGSVLCKSGHRGDTDGILLAKALLKASSQSKPGILPLEFVLQRCFLLLSPDDIDDQNDRYLYGGKSRTGKCLNDLVEKNTLAWDLGFDRVHRAHWTTSSQAKFPQDAAPARSKDEEMTAFRWFSLWRATEEGASSLVKLEIEKVGNSDEQGDPERFPNYLWHLIEQTLWHDIYSDRMLAEIVEMILKYTKPALREDLNSESSFHYLCKKHYEHTANVLIKEWPKWRKVSFTKDPNETIEEYSKMEILTDFELYLRRGDPR